MKKLIVLFFILYSSNCFAIVLGSEFIAIRLTQDTGGVIIVAKSQLTPFISKDGLEVWIYIGSGSSKEEIAKVPFKTRADAVWWIKENFEPKCMTRKEFDKKCDPIDAPDLNSKY